jgi:hypothetical protein
MKRGFDHVNGALKLYRRELKIVLRSTSYNGMDLWMGVLAVNISQAFLSTVFSSTYLSSSKVRLVRLDSLL